MEFESFLVSPWTFALDAQVDDEHHIFILPLTAASDAAPVASSAPIRSPNGSIVRTVRDWYSAADDAVTIAKTIADFGVSGRVTSDGRYLVLKGFAGARRFLRGTRYRVDSARVLQFCAGTRGGVAAFRASLKKSSWFLLADVTVETALRIASGGDLRDLVADETVDIAKGVLAAAAGAAAGVAVVSVAAAGTIAVLPVVASVAVSWGIGAGLDALDDEFRMTERMRDLVHELYRHFAESEGGGRHPWGQCPGGFPRTGWDAPHCSL